MAIEKTTITQKSPNEKFERLKGLTMVDSPRIPRMLKTFDPITFPIAISECLRMAATTEVASSGVLVPAATIVRPITASLIFNICAILVADPSRKCEPNINKIRPPKIKATSSQIDFVGFGIPSSNSLMTSVFTSQPSHRI